MFWTFRIMLYPRNVENRRDHSTAYSGHRMKIFSSAWFELADI
jgi:hypothetical protein